MSKPSGRPNKSGGRKLSPVPASAAHRVAFAGIIKSIKTALDNVGDKVGTLIVTFRPEGKTVADLDALQKPDKEVYIVILDKADE
jgi:pyruvate/2-oxoglutarate dehydrogenase complex dihydrolipoamide acyltransferase (E2) component